MLSPIDQVLEQLQGVRRRGVGWTSRCPAHPDRVPSLSISVGDDGRVLLYCHGGCSLKAICSGLGILERDLFAVPRRCVVSRKRRNGERGDQAFARGLGAAFSELQRAARERSLHDPAFTAAQAQRVWQLARSRARDDDAVGHDRAVYDYVAARRLDQSLEEPGYGVIGPDMELPPAVAWWVQGGYRLLLPVYDEQGLVVSIQARCIAPDVQRRVLFPKGSRIKGAVFANSVGVSLLGQRRPPTDVVLFGEGLTDFLAIASAASTYAVLAAPGTSFACPAAGRWARQAVVVVAMDNDEAGQRCIEALGPRLYELGAKDVLRVQWPNGCKDACDLVKEVGVIGLSDFLKRQIGEVESP